MKVPASSLAPILGSDTLGRILARLFADPDTGHTGSELVVWAGSSMPTVLREIERAERPASSPAPGSDRPASCGPTITTVDRVTGETAATYSSRGEPDRVLYKACEIRRATRCGACAAIYQGDARVLVL